MSDLSPGQQADLDQKRALVRELVDDLAAACADSLADPTRARAESFAREFLEPLLRFEQRELSLVLIELVGRLGREELARRQLREALADVVREARERGCE